MHRRGAVISALVSSACFGTLAILGRLMYERGAEPLQVLSWRFLLAGSLLALYSIATGSRGLRLPIREIRSIAAIALFGYGAASLCFFFALDHADASIVAILLYTYPGIIVLVELVTARVVPTFGRIAAVLLTFAGCVFVVDPFGGALSVEPLGVILGLGAGVGYATFSLMSARTMRRNSRLAIMTYLFLFTGLLAVIAALATGSRLSTADWSLELWGLLATLILVPTFAAVLLYLRAVHALGVSQAAILSTFEPVFTLALAVLLLAERLTAIQWAGAALVLVGVVVAERTSHAVEEPVL